MNDVKFYAKVNAWLLPTRLDKPRTDIKVCVGDLLNVGQRLCLVMKITRHKKIWHRNVLIRWLGEDDSYWVRYNTLLALASNKNENKNGGTNG